MESLTNVKTWTKSVSNVLKKYYMCINYNFDGKSWLVDFFFNGENHRLEILYIMKIIVLQLAL